LLALAGDRAATVHECDTARMKADELIRKYELRAHEYAPEPQRRERWRPVPPTPAPGGVFVNGQPVGGGFGRIHVTFGFASSTTNTSGYNRKKVSFDD